MFFSTHILADVERVCDRVAILDRGRVVAQAGIDELKTRHGGGHVVSVEVDDPARLAAALAAEPWVKEASRDGRELSIDVTDLETAFSELPGVVAAQGLALRRLDAAEVSLEEVFVDLVAGGAMSRRQPRRLASRGFAPSSGRSSSRRARPGGSGCCPAIMVLLLGLGTPVLTAVTPALLRATERSQPGVVIKLPAPTSIDSYLQFMGNLDQVALLVIIITGAAIVASERRAGTIVLVLTKPLSRSGFIVAKAVSQLALLVAATALGDAGLHPRDDGHSSTAAHIAAFIASVALWLVLAAMFTLLMLLLSAAHEGAGAGRRRRHRRLRLARRADRLPAHPRPLARRHHRGQRRPAEGTRRRPRVAGRRPRCCWPVAFLYAAVRVVRAPRAVGRLRRRRRARPERYLTTKFTSLPGT